MVTLKQIAQACGVSVASVSKALNDAKDIGPATKERIIHTAREMGYFPNAAARALKTNRTYNIGVLFEDNTESGLTHEYFSYILNAVKKEVEAHGYDITFINRNIGSMKMSFLEHCRYRNCDGLVIANVDFSDPDVTALADCEIPMVSIDYAFDDHDAVFSDNAQGIASLVAFLYEKGHKEMAFIHGEDTVVTRTRIDSFRNACMKHGIKVLPEWMRQGSYHDPRMSGEITGELLRLPNPPRCIIYPDDISLLGGMTQIEKMGLKIPGDISVVGYDGIEISRLLRPILTTVRQDSEQLGRAAAKLLLEAIEAKGNKEVRSVKRVMVPCEVQPGQTVKDLTDSAKLNR